MKFSEAFELGPADARVWFDPLLNLDTALYVDPFLMYAQEFGPFEGSHEELIAYFDRVYKLIARSRGDQKSIHWRMAQSLLEFPEVDEFCLGVSRSSVDGAGGGRGYARSIAIAMWTSIQAGLESPTHFEEIQLFGEGIGPDRVSDAVGNLLKHRFAQFTESICEELRIDCEPVEIDAARFDLTHNVWVPQIFRLPINPFTGAPILLVPRRFLREMPTLNPGEFWRYCGAYHGEALAAQFGFDIQSRVSKEHIIELARAHPEFVREYSGSLDDREVDPYDFARDKSGLYGWYDSTKIAVRDNPVELPRFETPAEFLHFVHELVRIFQHYVENQRGWTLLWNDDETSRPEHAAQDLFLGITKHYCVANNVDISREPNLGRGPVDFKLARGQAFRALIEVKLAKNTRFWHGLERQLPKYLEVEDVKAGFFLVMLQRDADIKKVKEIQGRVAKLNARLPYDLTAVIVDARHSPPSASIL